MASRVFAGAEFERRVSLTKAAMNVANEWLNHCCCHCVYVPVIFSTIDVFVCVRACVLCK